MSGSARASSRSTITPTVIERLGQQTIGYAQAAGRVATPSAWCCPARPPVGADRPLADRDAGGGLPSLRRRRPGLPPAGRPLGLRRLAPDGPERQDGEAGGEGEPGQRVAEVGVAEADHRQAAAGPAAGVGSGVGVDEVGGDRGRQARGGGDGRDVAGVPAAGGRVVAAEEAAAGLAQAEEAGDGDFAADWPSARVAGSRRSGGTKPRLTRTVKPGVSRGVRIQ